MLQLRAISLVQFKNYAQRRFAFESRIVGICGNNGVGKTNLLEAIYYLCFTKGYFGRTDAQNVQNGTTGFRIEGAFDKQGEASSVVCILRDAGKKEFLLDGESYDKFSHHIGKYPCVMIAPDDVRMITEGSEERRRYVDAMLSQLDPEYLQRLMNYNRIVQQRNSSLKAMAESRSTDSSLLDVYDSQMIRDGQYLFERRRAFLEGAIGDIQAFYCRIAGADENLELKYESQLMTEDFGSLLKRLRDRDLAYQRTHGGIHKDDLLFRLDGQPFKTIASQGQRKSLLFALKLAEFDILRQNKSFAPLLLLDDVFEKLDEQRMHNLLQWVCVENDGQLFITDTHRERIANHFSRLGIAFQLVDL